MATTLTAPVATDDKVDEVTAPPPPPPGRARRARRGPRPPRPARPRQPFRVTTGVVIAVGLMLVTGLVALFGCYLFVGSGLAANRAQDQMYGQLKTGLAQETVPFNGALPTAKPVGIVKIPKIGVDQVFVEGSSSDQTMNGPGLKHDSVLPGQAGVSVLVGRRSTFGAPFAHLDRLQVGDSITVITGQGTFTYVVDLVRTSDAAASKIREVASRLTLQTSDPAMTPTRDLLVSAHLHGKALPATTRSATVAADTPGQGSHDREISLLLWSQALLLTVVVVSWAALRLPGRQALWIGAVPVVLALLWNVFENLALLLPNTL